MSISQCEETQTPRLGNLVKTRVTMLSDLPQPSQFMPAVLVQLLKVSPFILINYLVWIINYVFTYQRPESVTGRGRVPTRQCGSKKQNPPTVKYSLPSPTFHRRGQEKRHFFFFTFTNHTLNFLHGYKPIRGAVGKRHIFCNYIRL